VVIRKDFDPVLVLVVGRLARDLVDLAKRIKHTLLLACL
jgi:hypothetical protein